MQFEASSTTALGEPLVSICGPEGYTPEQWAAMAVHRIISIADTAPMPIREQAYAFRAQMLAVITSTVREAIQQRKM